MHEDMQAMSIESLYGVVNHMSEIGSPAALFYVQWAQYYIDCKFNGQFQ